jgi:signal transduction histidine kinase
MSENLDANSSQANLDYQRALEVICEASEATVNALGHEAVEQASLITYESGVIAPRQVVEEAEHIKYLYWVSEPEAVVQEAEEIITYNNEVVSAGEELNEDEDVDEEVAGYASSVLIDDYLAEAYRLSAYNKSAYPAYKYLLSKAATEEDRQRINQEIQDRFKKDDDK